METPAIPPNQRLYIIGDIHGRDELLVRLLDKINEDARAYTGSIRKIFLGDYIDRGLYSRQVIDRLIALGNKEEQPPIYLMGNHEQVMREILRGDDGEYLQNWLRFGGRETLMSYGISPPLTMAGGLGGLAAVLKEKIPQSHVDFLEGLQTSVSFGDYFFCHAGVRPGVDLDAQLEHDLVWIRYEFLGSKQSHGKVVVHGHTIVPEPEILPNRINIDTGAYATGRLTALGLEGTNRWLLHTK